MTALHAKNAAKNLSKSCRGIGFMAMCHSDGADPMDPLTWSKSCAMGDCTSCPVLQVDTEGCQMEDIQVYSWRKGVAGVDAAGKDKEMFTLFLDQIPLVTAVSNLQNMAKMIKTHIYVAYRQWEYTRELPSKLVPLKSILTVEDYQQNAEITLDESPTETNFGKNKIQVAIYPIHTAFRLTDGGPVLNCAITFVR